MARPQYLSRHAFSGWSLIVLTPWILNIASHRGAITHTPTGPWRWITVLLAVLLTVVGSLEAQEFAPLPVVTPLSMGEESPLLPIGTGWSPGSTFCQPCVFSAEPGNSAGQFMPQWPEDCPPFPWIQPLAADSSPRYPWCVRVCQSVPNSANATPSNTGTVLDSLPSFRGIKGIKNLPGGVGTLLMSNPHLGTTWYPEQSADQPGTSLSIDRFYFQGGVPIYSNGVDTVVFTSHLDQMNIQTSAILPTTMQPFPNQLFHVAFGANVFHQFDSGKVGGIIFDAGTATDMPFHSSSEMLLSGTAFLLIPSDDRSAWFVGVNASTNSQVLYGLPIPGGGYFYNPSEDFQAIIGFPFSVVSWRPAPDWQLQYVYAFLTTMHARAVYQPTNDWQLYAGFDWTNENWRRVDRPQSGDHFFYYEKRLSAGWLWWFQPNVGFEVSGGWAFDRYFTEVDGFQLQGFNTVHIGSGPFLSAQFDVRF